MTTYDYDQAMAARSTGDLQGARQILLARLDADHSDEKARSALAAVSLELGDPLEAVRILHPLAAKYPTNAVLLARYGVALREAGRLTDAITVLSRATELDNTEGNRRELDATVRLRAAQTVTSTRTVSAAPTIADSTSPSPNEPAGRTSLATSLDDESPPSHTSVQVRGELKASWRRRATSYRRFWIGALGCVVGAAILLISKASGKASPAGAASVSRTLHNVYLVPALIGAAGLILMCSTFVASRFTRYKVYEHRIDFERGILSQVRRPVWLFDITSVSLQRPPVLTLTHTACIIVEHDTKAGKLSREKLIATSPVGQMSEFAEQLQGLALRERRAMKKMWI